MDSFDRWPELSIVIPAYNEEKRLPGTLEELSKCVERGDLPANMEILVIDDGSLDGTKAVRPRSLRQGIDYQVVTIAHGGKGAAVREGLKRAGGRWVLIADADLSTSFAMYPVLKASAVDGAIASRGLKNSRITIRQPGIRHELGRAFNLFVRAVTGLPYYDTQCGFKLFKQEAARGAADYLTLSGFAFDVEMLMILRRAGFCIVEVPVEWSHMEDSRVRAFADGFKMGLEVLRLSLRFLAGTHPVAHLSKTH
ncbi:MAG: glycosyltransferase family 2 protein [Candidatus Omnitrophica bacterium]|nr:glycosyltransferase family 2 protein [Candidatus Omnitrophota bacterium]